MGHIMYFSGLGVQKAKVETISQVLQPRNFSQSQTLLGLCNYQLEVCQRFQQCCQTLNPID